jgi:hypothetical protein
MTKKRGKTKKPPRRDANEAAYDVMQRVIAKTEGTPTKPRAKKTAKRR